MQLPQNSNEASEEDGVEDVQTEEQHLPNKRSQKIGAENLQLVKLPKISRAAVKAAVEVRVGRKRSHVPKPALPKEVYR